MLAGPAFAKLPTRLRRDRPSGHPEPAHSPHVYDLDFRALFEAAPGAFLVLSPDEKFTILAASDRYLTATSATRAAIVGRPLFEVFPDPPDDPEATGTTNLRASLLRAIATRCPDEMLVQRYPIRVNGGRWEERYWRVINKPVISRDGAVTMLIHYVEDVTELHRLETTEREAMAERDHAIERERMIAQLQEQAVELEAQAEELQATAVMLEEQTEQAELARADAAAAEQRLRDLFEQAPVAVAVMSGPELVYTITSPRYVEMLGGRRLIGRPLREALPELAGQQVIETVRQVYQTGVPYSQRERMIRLDKDQSGTLEEYYFNVGYQPLRDAQGRVYAVASTAYEMTDQVRVRRVLEHAQADGRAARESAEQAQHDAENANRAKSEFLAVMSHELRTPLNAIGGYAELMQLGIHGDVTREQLNALERIQRSQRHLLGLINGVLNYSRLEAGVVDYQIADVPLEDALAACESLVAPQLRARGLTLTSTGCPPGAQVRADREKLQQIILNVLSNAVKFTEPGGRIEIACSAAPNGMMSVRISDTGRGIPREQLERVFQPFVQVDAGLTRTQDGVGLGLAISRDLARGMGGELSVESEPGRGSAFTLTVPCADGTSAPARR
jgi:signal transduction histidine kinase